MNRDPISVWEEAFHVPMERAGRRARLREIFWQAVAIVGVILLSVLPWTVRAAEAAGTLTPVGSSNQPIQIRDHHLEVVITNGFAKTEVQQIFYNPNVQDLEGIYSFPVPKSASLSEFTIFAGESRIDGEVVPKADAHRMYEEEKQQGNDAGVADRNSYQNFEFRVARIPAQGETRIRFVYYQPLPIDSGVGKYLYPLEDGGTDDLAKGFWSANDTVTGTLSGTITVRMAAPIEELRIPGLEGVATVERLSKEESRISFRTNGGALNKDIVLYYRLAQDLPGRLDIIPYREDPTKPGTFMMVLTPGDDLGPIEGGADYTFILDRSGSMQGKLHTLTQGVRKAIGQLKQQDRFRVIAFSDTAQSLTGGFVGATPEAVQQQLANIERLTAAGGTNLYAGMQLGLAGLDADRVQSIVLVTDGVTNTGIIDPREFEKLLQGTDVRIFGFLLGNSANWPLMELVCDLSGGFYAAVSNADDIVGQLMLAKAKITSEALHDLDISIRGGGVSELTEGVRKKLYRGEQVVVFGRYHTAEPISIEVKATISGVPKQYTTTFTLPENEVGHPEVERLWAMNRIEDIERAIMRGRSSEGEGKQAIASLATEYQLVTDETSMVVLSDAAFARHGVERRNQARALREEHAQTARSASPVYQPRVDAQQPLFGNQPAFHISRGGGGGALPAPFAMVVIVMALALGRGRRWHH